MKADLPRLTQRAAGGGCACKVPAERLSQLLEGVPRSAAGDDRILVGNDTLDDAAVVRLSDDQAIVQTVDVFTPIVDDAYDFGRIAATNAISDVFAMGGRPLFALAIGGFPDDLPGEEVSEILRGGADVANAAGAPILGGHTITTAEPLYGLAVTGLVDPARVWRNAGAQIGDVLVLTKALGTGIVANALRKDAVDDDVLAAAIASMTTLNGASADALRAVGPHAVTDVTGFGLLGHLLEIAKGSKVAARLDFKAIPLLPGAAEFAAEGTVTGASARNWAGYGDRVKLGEATSDAQKALLTDPQTSGGLLVACAPEASDEVLKIFRSEGFDRAAIVGEVLAGAAEVRVD